MPEIQVEQVKTVKLILNEEEGKLLQAMFQNGPRSEPEDMRNLREKVFNYLKDNL